MDWINFFQSRGVHFRTAGPNTAQGNVTIHCPWCGLDDPSEHLSVSTEGKGFRCWRKPEHSGKNPAKLIQAILSCSWEQAISIAGHRKTLPDSVLSRVKGALSTRDDPYEQNKLTLPKEFKPFQDKPSFKPFRTYLNNRGFSDLQISDATSQYGIYYVTQGYFRGRIIFTVVKDGQLCGWTGRTIYDQEIVRYSTLTTKPEKAKSRGETPAKNPIGHYLLFYDLLLDNAADTLFLCEGPFDAWRVNVLGKNLGVAATCFFTNTPSKYQINLLHELAAHYDNTYLVLDVGMFSKSLKIAQDFSAIGIKRIEMLPGVKDPGELKSEKQLAKMLAVVR
jgi:hypothetical protein